MEQVAGGQLSAGHAARATIIALCFSVAMLEGYDIQTLGVVAPQVIPALHLSPSQAGIAFSASMFGLVLGAIVGGWLADRFGRRPVLVGSVAVFGVLSLITMIVPDYLSLVAVRAATGLGLGGAMPNMIAIAAEISAPNRRTTTATMMFCGLPLGGTLASLFARYLLPYFSWPSVFVFGGVVPVLLVPFLLTKLPETRPSLSAVERADARAWGALFAGGRAVTTVLLWASFALNYIVLYLLLNWLPTLAAAKGVSPTGSLMASVMLNVGAVIGVLLLGRSVDRFGPRWPVVLSYVALVITMVAMGAADSEAMVIFDSTIAGFLVVGSQYALYGLPPIYYPAAMRAFGAGSAVAIGRIGSIIGPLLAGQLLGAGATVNQVLFSTAPVAFVTGASVLLLTFIGKAYKD